MSQPLKLVIGVLLALSAAVHAEESDGELPPPPQLVAPSNTPTEAGEPPSVPSSPDRLVSVLKRRLPTGKVELSQAPEWFQTMVQHIVRENVPHKYVRDKDWGMTERRWNGIRVRRNGFRISTKRKWKDVNHGTWKRYEITQIDPQNNLTLRIENVRDAGKGNIAFDVYVTSKVHVYGRTSQWAKGVRLYSVSADAEADVRLKITGEFGIQLDPKKFPPDIVCIPKVTDAKLDVSQFSIERVSKFDGPVVKQFSKSVHKVLLDKLEEKRDRLPEKINRQIAKHHDKMRLSLSDFATEKWKQLTADGVTATK